MQSWIFEHNELTTNQKISRSTMTLTQDSHFPFPTAPKIMANVREYS